MKAFTWNNRFLPRFLIAYMLLALLWWSYLLFQKNADATSSNLRLLQLEKNVEFHNNEFDIATTEEYQTIMKKHNRQKWMIIGEGIVFAFTLIIGMHLINKAHNQEIEASNRQKNFLLSITHELKSPLASIGLILETFIKRNLNAEKVKELSGNALSESQRLEKQINNLLMAARVEKAYEFNFVNDNIIPIIDEIINTQKSIHTHIFIERIDNNTDIFVEIDKEAFYSIIGNIVENAIKYSNDPAKVMLQTASQNDYITITIADNGIGIPEDERENVVKQFYRIGNEETRKTKGTGLGLFIVKKLVLAHNGNITISSNHPRGTIFTLTFPKVQR